MAKKQPQNNLFWQSKKAKKEQIKNQASAQTQELTPNKIEADSTRDSEQQKNKAGWQILLGFGVSFALQVYVLGFWLGGFLDKKFAGDKGYLTLACVVVTIILSFYLLYKDLIKLQQKK